MDNNTILIFKSITGFISDLNTEFGSKHKSIALYNRLLEKTGIVHVGPVHKHINCFRSFFSSNVKAMEEQNISLFLEPRISYSDRVYVDVLTIFRQSSEESSSIIWKHLLTIWGLIEPTSQAKRILNESIKQSNGADKESKFLSDIIERVEKSVSSSDVDVNSNPMAAVSNLMNSGVFTDLINGMQTGLSDGSLDIGKLMGSVQGMMSKMGGSSSSSSSSSPMPDMSAMPDMGAMMGMMGSMMGGMSANGGGPPPDMSAIMNMVGSMMGGGNVGNVGNVRNVGNSGNKLLDDSKKDE